MRFVELNAMCYKSWMNFLRSFFVISICLSTSIGFAQKNNASSSADRKVIDTYASRKGCGPYTATQLQKIQEVADRLLAKCVTDQTVCKDAQDAVTEVNKIILDIDSMKYVFGSEYQPTNESLMYALKSIGASTCFSAQTENEKNSQYKSILDQGFSFVFSAAIACHDQIRYFKIGSAVYKIATPLTAKNYEMTDEYEKYLDTKDADSWENNIVPYSITDESYEIYAEAEPTSEKITARFGYTKKNGKITPDDFKGFKNLITTASFCVYKKMNDGNHEDDDRYQLPVFSDNFPMLLHK